MKRFKKPITLFVAAVMCMMCFFNTSIFATAEEGPVTYHVRYVNSFNDWRYQTGTWTDGGSTRDLYYLTQYIKDGDIIVIDGSKNLNLKVDVHLSNLTLANTDFAVVHAKGYDVVHVLDNSKCAVNGDVKHAEVYRNTVVNFNNNVETLKLINTTGNEILSSVNVVGTVGHVTATGNGNKYFELYSFQPNSFVLENGILKTDSSQCSTTPPTTTTPPANNNSNDYDEVPKTGESRFNPLWLVGLAAVCMLGAYKLKERY